MGDGEQRRDFTHVSDVCNANIMAAIGNADEEAYGQVYNVGCSTNYSINEIADMISDNKLLSHLELVKVKSLFQYR